MSFDRDERGFQRGEPFAGVHDATHGRPHDADEQVGPLQQREMDRPRRHAAAVQQDVAISGAGECVGQVAPQVAGGASLLGTGQPGDHLGAAAQHLCVLGQGRGLHLPARQRKQGQQPAGAVDRRAVLSAQPQGDVAPLGIGIDEQDRSRPQGGGQQRGRRRAGCPLGGQEG